MTEKKGKIKTYSLVNRTPCATTMDLKLFETLTNYSQETGIPKSKLIDEAIKLLFQKRHIS